MLSFNLSHCSMENYTPGCELADPRFAPVSGDQGGSSVMWLRTMAREQTNGGSALQYMDPSKSNEFSSLGVKKMLRVDQLKSLGALFQRDTSAELKLQEGQWLFFTHTL